MAIKFWLINSVFMSDFDTLFDYHNNNITLDKSDISEDFILHLIHSNQFDMLKYICEYYDYYDIILDNPKYIYAVCHTNNFDFIHFIFDKFINIKPYISKIMEICYDNDYFAIFNVLQKHYPELLKEYCLNDNEILYAISSDEESDYDSDFRDF